MWRPGTPIIIPEELFEDQSHEEEIYELLQEAADRTTNGENESSKAIKAIKKLGEKKVADYLSSL